MAEKNIFQGEMDPEIAALLGTAVDRSPGENAANPPNFASIFDEQIEPGEETDTQAVNLNTERFPEITKHLEPVPHNIFNDPNYYKTALSGEGDIAKRVHTILQKYLNAKDPKDRSVYRQQFITAYWDFLLGIAKKAPGRLSNPKKYLLRFNLLHPTFVDAETRTFFAKIVVDNELNLPVYYLDEWFKLIGTGILRNSTTDEVRIAKNNNQIRLQQLLEKAMGKLDGSRSLLRAKDEERRALETTMQDRVNIIFEHFPLDGFNDIHSCYTDTQKRVFGEIQELMKSLLRTDHELDLFLKDYHQAEADVRTLRDKVEEEGGAIAVDVRAVDTEFETIRQMAKLTIGRQGNHFPLLNSEYFHCGPAGTGFRENIIAQLTLIESIDPEVFCRSYKNRLNRIAPYVVLIPSYGDLGICWEPFDRFNRATSRGRIAIPMYPKNLYIAVLSAVADLRWQVAKEKASYYWMEEGLTGNYYQWFTARKLKGDVKEYFIQDYIVWMTKEAEAIQKLDKEVRGIFWRYMPFSKAIKDKLKNRSYVYQELYQRDINRSLSDGY
ncbi:MAG: hypothetical protein LBK02_06230 [Treponema sp.]|jgi:hypothetical protein|nr:hypothetical protein [Treponema sp.]